MVALIGANTKVVWPSLARRLIGSWIVCLF